MEDRRPQGLDACQGRQVPRYCTFPFDLSSPLPTQRRRGNRHPGPTQISVVWPFEMSSHLRGSPRPRSIPHVHYSHLGSYYFFSSVKMTKQPPESSLCVSGICGQVVSPDATCVRGILGLSPSEGTASLDQSAAVH